MLPWPKPAVWPAVPSDAAARILAKEQVHSVLLSVDYFDFGPWNFVLPQGFPVFPHACVSLPTRWLLSLVCLHFLMYLCMLLRQMQLLL